MQYLFVTIVMGKVKNATITFFSQTPETVDIDIAIC